MHITNIADEIMNQIQNLGLNINNDLDNGTDKTNSKKIKGNVYSYLHFNF